MKTTSYLKLLAGVTPLLSVAHTVEAQNKPNVILIYTDDQGALDMGCYGAKDLQTPNMDALAQKGVRFSQFYAAPISSPSRASLLTGQFTRHADFWDNAGSQSGISPNKQTLAEKMKASGYTTGLIGKWHLGEKENNAPNARGFDYFFGHKVGCIDNFSHFFYWGGPNRHDLWRNTEEVFYPGEFFADLMLKETRNFIHDNKNNPFFLYWAVNLPHYPLQGKTKWLDYYKSLPYPRNLYAAFVSTLDDYLGDLMVFLESEGLIENTIIIFQSDNGPSVEVRNHSGGGYTGPYRGAKFSLFEGGVRIPAIISWPGHIPQNEVRDQMAMNVDWFPTIVDLCGLSTSGMNVDGKSLVPVLKQAGAQSQHEALFFDSGKQWAVRKGDWKLIGNPQDPTDPKSITPADSLFLVNLKTDISETTNLVKKEKKVLSELMKLREDYIKKCDAENRK